METVITTGGGGGGGTATTTGGASGAAESEPAGDGGEDGAATESRRCGRPDFGRYGSRRGAHILGSAEQEASRQGLQCRSTWIGRMRSQETIGHGRHFLGDHRLLARR